MATALGHAGHAGHDESVESFENLRRGRIGTDRNLPEGSSEVTLQYHAVPCTTTIHLSLPELLRASNTSKMI